MQSTERQKTNFLKVQVENLDIYKSLVNKIMTTHEQCMKYNFVAPLNAWFLFPATHVFADIFLNCG